MQDSGEKVESLSKKEKTPYSKDLYADGVALSGGEIQEDDACTRFV